MNLNIFNKLFNTAPKSGFAKKEVPKSYKLELSLLTLKNFLIEELQPFPGRLAISTQMVVLSTLWVIAAMSMQIPDSWLSAYVIFLTIRRDSISTALAGYTTLLGCSIALLLSILLLMLTAGEPALRVPLMGCLIFVGMYATSILKAARLALSVASLLALMFGVIDTAPNPEALVPNLLWIWLAYALPIVFLVLINILVADDPAKLFEEGLALRLNASALALEKGTESKEFDIFNKIYNKGMATQRGLQDMAALRYHEYKERRQSDLALLSIIDRVMAAIHALPQNVDSLTYTKQLMKDLSIWCFNIQKKLKGEKVSKLEFTGFSNHDQELALLPLLSLPLFSNIIESLHTLVLAVSKRSEGVHSQEKGVLGKRNLSMAKQSNDIFVSDAFTNPDYLRFSLKTTLAAMVAYLFYIGSDWPGARICVVTCIIVARSSYGETIHLLTMRLLGVIAGAMLGALVMICVIPYINTIVGFSVLIATGGFLCAWVSSGSDRIAFFGLQMSLAFFLCTLHSFGPSADLVVIRDSILGILVGNVLMSFVFFVLWPSSASKPLKEALASNFDDLKKMILLENTLEHDKIMDALYVLHRSFESNMDIARGYLPFISLEPRSLRTKRAASGRGDTLLLEALFTTVNTIAEHRPSENLERLISPAVKKSIWYCNREIAGWFIHYAYVIRSGDQSRPYRTRKYFADLEQNIRQNMHSYDSTPMLRLHLRARLKWYNLLYSQMELAGRNPEHSPEHTQETLSQTN